MKRVLFLLIAFAVLVCFSNQAVAATMTVKIVGLAYVYGFGMEIIADPSAEGGDFTLNNYYAPADAIPNAGYWDIWIATTPALGVQGMDYTISAPLGEGRIFSVYADFDFELDNFLLGGTGPGGSYPYPFLVQFDDATDTYTYAPVPIPGAVWLLGSGLVGLIGLKRRFRG